MHCQKCGAENLENAALCQQCGGVFVYSQPTRTSGMAITSMILGIGGYPMFGVFIVNLTLGLIFGILALVTWIISLVFGTLALIIWLVGLVLGIMALGKVGRSGGQIKGKGFSITGISASASGLAVLLIVIGVLVFLNSTITMSLHKKIKMQDSFATQTAGRPQIQGWVYVLNDKNKADDNCTAALFSPEQTDANNAIFESDIICTPEDKKPSTVKWKFIGSKKGSDSYLFNITVPAGENATSTISKSIVYDGEEQIVFEDARRKIYIRPEK